MSKLLLATTNQGKTGEYRHLLDGLPFQLVSLIEEGITVAVEENYATLEENARQKAAYYAVLSSLITLADDSGLEVDALGGEPGVRSARYAGDGASDSDKVDYLLTRLKDVPWEKRTARFKCVIAVATPEERLDICQGECQGIIAFEPRGENGFGYDPVFYLPEYDKTMAEIPPELKNRISHRARAAGKVYKILEKFVKRAVL